MTDTCSDNDDDYSSTDNSSEESEPEQNKIEFDPIKFFTNKELCYYKMIDKFFKSCTEEQITKMLAIVNGKSNISLRVLDWFVTRYSKKKSDFNETTNGETFDVHISYKSQLKSYRKKYFDPFRRRKKFHYSYDKTDPSKTFHTTLGQLNFFYWAISNNIIAFVENHVDKILKAMNQSNKEDKKKKETKKKNKNKIMRQKKVAQESKQKDVNITAKKTMNDDEVQIVLSFD